MDPVLCQLINDLKNPQQQISVICMGIKAGGKSTRVLSLIRYCCEHDLFDDYFLFLPAYGIDIGNSYAWLKAYKSKVTIFTTYNPAFCEWILSQSPAEVKKHKKGTLIFLDDLGCNSDFNASDKHFFRLIGVQRHYRVSTILNFHSLASQRVISPFLRSNATYYLCFKISNWKVIRSFWEEVLSSARECTIFKEFFAKYRHHVQGEFNKKTREITPVYRGIAIHTASGEVSWDLDKWFERERVKNSDDNKKLGDKCPSSPQQWTFQREGEKVTLSKKQKSDSQDGTASTAKPNVPRSVLDNLNRQIATPRITFPGLMTTHREVFAGRLPTSKQMQFGS